MTYATAAGIRDACRMSDRRRVTDAERATALARLELAYAAGQLSSEELAQRSGLARAAVTRADLAAVLADLEEDTEAEVRGWRDRGWRTHAGVYAATAAAVIGLWQITRDRTPAPWDEGAGYWWPLWLALWWGLLVLLHYLHAAGLLPPVRRLVGAGPAAPPPPPPAARPSVPVPEPGTAAGGGALDTLTAREREILALVAQGSANKEIARRLHISERTARTHVSNILQKLNLPSRTHAAVFALRAGLPPAEPRG